MVWVSRLFFIINFFFFHSAYTKGEPEEKRTKKLFIIQIFVILSYYKSCRKNLYFFSLLALFSLPPLPVHKAFYHLNIISPANESCPSEIMFDFAAQWHWKNVYFYLLKISKILFSWISLDFLMWPSTRKLNNFFPSAFSNS